jgi:hypothetical protein
MSKLRFVYKVNSNRCASFRRYRGLIQPRCGCGACWDFYFYKNPGKLLAGKLAIEKLGEEVVVKAQGAQFYEAIRDQIVKEFISGKRQSVDKEAIIQNRGEKYLKNLKRFLKSHPISENDFSITDEEVAAA